MKNTIKNTLLSGSIIAVSALSSQAAVIVFTNVDPDVGTVNAGTLVAGQTLADMDEITTLSYTVSGLTIDNDGVDNDQITVSITIGGINGTINWDNGSATSTTTEIDHNNGVFSTDDGISFGSIAVTGTLSGGDAIAVNSAVYDNLQFRRWANAIDEEVEIAGVVNAAFNYNDPSSNVALNDETSFSITHVSGGTWQVDNFDFTVDVTAVVPEPSSTALLGLGGLALILRRRK